MKQIIAVAAAVVASAALAFTALQVDFGAQHADATTARTPTRTPTRVATSTPVPTPTPIPAPNPAIGPFLWATECISGGPHSVRAIFLWTPSQAGPQWFDLSISNDGFAPGNFIGLGGYEPGRWGLVWDGLLQGTTHYARVNTLTSEGWKASRTLSFFTPVCDPAAYAPPPGPDMLWLRDNLAAAVAGSGIDAAVAITDLRTGETVDVNGWTWRLPGCTINLFALLQTTIDLQFGRYPEPEPGSLIGQTINQSNPVTARSLMKYWIGNGDLYSGLYTVNDLMLSLGMNETWMDHPPAFMHESIYGGASNNITALDANRGLRAIWDGRVLNPWWRDYLLYKMTLVKPGLNYLIPSGVGAGAIASHKNGFLYEEGWADNDIGIVWFERGGQRYGYAISFFTQYVPSKYADIPLGQRVSSLAYQWFVGRYGYP